VCTLKRLHETFNYNRQGYIKTATKHIIALHTLKIKPQEASSCGKDSFLS